MEPWQQGRLLQTANVSLMRAEERAYYDLEERRSIYENFSAIDEGKSRRLIAQCRTPEIAERIVKLHNEIVLKEKLENGTGKSETP